MQFFHEWGNSYAEIDRQLYRHVLNKDSGYDFLRWVGPFWKSLPKILTGGF